MENTDRERLHRDIRTVQARKREPQVYAPRWAHDARFDDETHQRRSVVESDVTSPLRRDDSGENPVRSVSRDRIRDCRENIEGAIRL